MIETVAMFDAWLPSSLPEVSLDAGELWQITLNLLHNAAQAMTAPDPSLHRVSFRAWEQDARLHIEVRDSGEGMSDEVKLKAREAFFSTRGSAGMGLALADQVVQKINGSMQIESVSGHGSTFILTIPCVRSSERAEPTK